MVSLFVGAASLVSPQAVGICCFFLVTLGCLIFGYSGSVWLSHFVFLSFLGGLLVIFLYACALAPSPLFISIWKTVKAPVKGWFVVSGLVYCLVWYSGRLCYLRFISENWYDWSHSPDPGIVGGSWIATGSFPFLAFLLALCMVSVTKLCSYNKNSSLRGDRSTMS
uniref:NADH dehydrogenase subunit 6 n=1 Tax=Mimachlamys varia TaxID=50417 RepID=UPI001FA6ECBC|nr:NADH dehydrogenase subunit 6 [Mimachlamys varia]UNA71546.1 NADH dehydrogenase subunit 6 [Mimachlamys varia]